MLLLIVYYLFLFYFMLEERHLLSWDQSFTLRTPELDPLAPPEKRKSTDHRVILPHHCSQGQE